MIMAIMTFIRRQMLELELAWVRRGDRWAGNRCLTEMLINNIGRVDIGWVVKALSNVLVLLVSLSIDPGRRSVGDLL